MRTDIKLNTKRYSNYRGHDDRRCDSWFSQFGIAKQEEVVETAQPPKLPFKVEVLHSNATEEQITALSPRI